MLRGSGGAVEIEGGSLSLEEQLALGEAAEKAKQEAEDAWNEYKDEQLVIANAKASSLTASTAPVISAEVVKAQAKAPWLRAEVSNSKKRIEDNIAQVAQTIDPDERVKLDEAITNELKTLQDWQTAKPVDPVKVRDAHIKTFRSRGKTIKQAEALADALIASQKVV